MTKKPSEIKISERKKKRKRKMNNKTNTDNNNNNSKESSINDNRAIQIANIIPVLEEEFSISKKTLTENVKIQKKWITKTKKIEVPVSIEDLYINDKRMKSNWKDNDDDQEEDVLSELNKRIVQSFEDTDDNQKKQYSILERNESKRELIPLFDDITNNSNNSSENYNIINNETEKIIPILGEQVVVSKRIVKIGELVITKNKVIENEKIAIDTRSEKVTIRYPDGSTKML